MFLLIKLPSHLYLLYILSFKPYEYISFIWCSLPGPSIFFCSAWQFWPPQFAMSMVLSFGHFAVLLAFILLVQRGIKVWIASGIIRENRMCTISCEPALRTESHSVLNIYISLTNTHNHTHSLSLSLALFLLIPHSHYQSVTNVNTTCMLSRRGRLWVWQWQLESQCWWWVGQDTHGREGENYHFLIQSSIKGIFSSTPLLFLFLLPSSSSSSSSSSPTPRHTYTHFFFTFRMQPKIFLNPSPRGHGSPAYCGDSKAS